ncbi:MAG: hypothetical protein IJ512_04690 [Ruminococcus sp.]|nr:hypothetical protein [Ruminococcus sp.]
MNREMLYREIGDIDDDLIQAANEAHRQNHKTLMLYRIAGIAACFCLICGGILFGLQKDSIYINEIPTPAASKVIVPADENTTIVPVTYHELLAYYGMEQMPDTFGKELTKTQQSFFVLYQNQAGDILYDTNILYYGSIDQSKTLSITLSKAEDLSNVSQEEMRQSKIDGVSLLLAASSNETGYTAYWAGLRLNGVSVQMISDGLTEDEFINAVTEFIQSLH